MAERRVWIPMADGVRPAASLFLPDGGEPRPVLPTSTRRRSRPTSAG